MVPESSIGETQNGSGLSINQTAAKNEERIGDSPLEKKPYIGDMEDMQFMEPPHSNHFKKYSSGQCHRSTARCFEGCAEPREEPVPTISALNDISKVLDSFKGTCCNLID